MFVCLLCDDNEPWCLSSLDSEAERIITAGTYIYIWVRVELVPKQHSFVCSSAELGLHRDVDGDDDAFTKAYVVQKL